MRIEGTVFCENAQLCGANLTESPRSARMDAWTLAVGHHADSLHEEGPRSVSMGVETWLPERSQQWPHIKQQIIILFPQALASQDAAQHIQRSGHSLLLRVMSGLPHFPTAHQSGLSCAPSRHSPRTKKLVGCNPTLRWTQPLPISLYTPSPYCPLSVQCVSPPPWFTAHNHVITL